MTASQADADRNVLFATLAAQSAFISRQQLAAGIEAWAADSARSIGDVLTEQNNLTPEEKSALDALVATHLARHGHDPARSLAALNPDAAVRSVLVGVSDRMVRSSLGQFAAAPPADGDSTGRVGSMAGQPSSPGGPTERDGRFQIVRPHARGGLGEVFVARDGELNREVALKEIQGHYADHDESRARFVLEAEITGALEHPGIVPVYGLGKYPDGRPFYAMRFIRGDSLLEAVTRFHEAEHPTRDPGERALALRNLLRRFVDVCHAMAYAHSRGVIHRDLKPGNVMVGQFGETLVVDWGLAKPLAAMGIPENLPLSVEGPIQPSALSDSTPTYAGTAVGTPQFMSPEQAAGAIETVGAASDVYSLGATLYAILVGRPPLDRIDISEILIRVQHGNIPPARTVNPKVPAALDAVCHKAMAPLPENRYPSALALAADVEKWLADEPVSAWREPFAVRARRWARRHRTQVAVGLAVLLVGGISLAVATVLLTAANRRERAAKLEAQANYRLARQAVDRFHTEVSEDVLLHEPGMEPLRRRLLEAARDFYATFVGKRTDDPEVKAEFGRALYRLAQITADVDAPAQGIELHQQALGTFNEVAASRPDDPELMADRAACLHHLGRLLRGQDKLAAARDTYREALGLWEKLEQLRPDEERFRAEEARTRLGLGNVEQDTRDLDRARAEYTAALAVREALAAAHPDRVDYTRDLATVRHNLAMVQMFAGPADQAEANFRKALADQERLAAAAPHVTQYADDAGRTHLNLGSLFAYRQYAKMRNADGDRAATEFEAAAHLYERLADTHPAVHRFRAGEGKSYLFLARVRWRMGQDGAAEAALAKAREVYRRLATADLRVPNDRVDLAAGHRQLGDLYRQRERFPAAREAYQKALDLLEPLAAGPDALPEYVAELASLWNNQGLLEMRESRNTAAAAAYRKSVSLWEGLVAAHPDNPDYRDGLRVARENLARIAGGEAVGT